MKVSLIKPIGHCFGVVSATKLAKEVAKENKDKNIYIFGSLVHNESVIEELKKINITSIDFTKENAYEILSGFSSDDIVIFSAHGHDEKYENFLKEKGILFYDATCQKVKRAFELIKKADEVIYIGKKNHPESNAALTMNNKCHFYDVNGDFDFSTLESDKPIVINQTTLSFLELKDIHLKILNNVPNAIIVDEICDATLLRQKAILNITHDVDLVLVVGSKKSSNTQKLFEVAKSYHKDKKVIFVENIKDLERISNSYKHAIIASGTSTPLNIIDDIKRFLEDL